MRSLGALGMSIGTSLAFEGDAAGTIRGSDTVLFNLMTLIRNAYDAYENKEEKGQLKADQLMEDVIGDLKIIARWIEDARKTKPITLTVYYPTYFSMAFRFPHAKLKVAKTEAQKHYKTLSEKVAKAVYSKFEKLITKTDVGMPAFKGRGIVLTHHVVDLALVEAVARLTLLESYTGKLKPYTQWFTKLTGGEELYYMPFNRLTIQIFGDRAVQFNTSSHGIKELVKKLARDFGWTSATTMARCRMNIHSLPTGVDKAGLLMML